MRRRGLLAAGAAAGFAAGLTRAAHAQSAVRSPMLDTIRKRGQLIAGVDTGIPGYAFQDSSGNWKGLDVSYVRAIAVAVLGSPDKVKYIGCTSQVRFSVLQSGEIDVLIRDSEHTLLRNSKLGFCLPAQNFYTGQSFMVNKSLKVAHVKELNGATIGLLTGTTLETNIANYNRANNIQIKTLLFDRPEEIYAAVQAGRCDGYTDDGGSVAAARSAMKTPADWVILPETISRQPLGSFTRFGDDLWASVVRWTHFAMLEAEALGINKANIDQVKQTTTDPQTKQFLGMEGGLGTGLGLDDSFAYQIVKSEGNYGEVYETYFGSKGLGLERGLNNLYLNGGLQYPWSWY